MSGHRRRREAADRASRQRGKDGSPSIRKLEASSTRQLVRNGFEMMLASKPKGLWRNNSLEAFIEWLRNLPREPSVRPFSTHGETAQQYPALLASCTRSDTTVEPAVPPQGAAGEGRARGESERATRRAGGGSRRAGRVGPQGGARGGPQGDALEAEQRRGRR